MSVIKQLLERRKAEHLAKIRASRAVEIEAVRSVIPEEARPEARIDVLDERSNEVTIVIPEALSAIRARVIGGRVQFFADGREFGDFLDACEVVLRKPSGPRLPRVGV
jgi:hypothetical protein